MSDAPETDLVALAAGGTGGHLFPAEALAQELHRRGKRVLLITDARGARFTENFPTDEQFQITAATPSIGGPVAKGMAAISIARGLMTAMGELKKRRPSVAVGFGGYPSLPAMKAAALLKIPYGVHEQNGVLGRANRMLVKEAAFVAHAFPVLEKLRADIQGVEVGNPLRDAVATVAKTPYQVSARGDVNLLIFGGSQGASIFSDAPVAAIAKLSEVLRHRLQVTHQAREGEVASVKASYEAMGVRAEVAPFFKDLPSRMAASHLVISRAGASTVTELSAIGRPSILVPLGIAMDDHQTGNARVLSEAGGAIKMTEKEFTPDALEPLLAELLSSPEKLGQMAKATKGRVKEGAASRLADLVEEIGGQRAAA